MRENDGGDEPNQVTLWHTEMSQICANKNVLLRPLLKIYNDQL
jgi:hypothetical protein